MKRFFVCLSCLLLLGGLYSCSGKGELEKFVQEFKTAVDNGDREAMSKMYPALEQGDQLSFDIDDIDVEKTDRAGVFIARLGDDVDMTIERSQDGTLTITESHGLFTFPKENWDFAKACGQYKAELTDVENRKRMNDTGFRAFLGDRLLADLRSQVTATVKISDDAWGSMGKIITTVNNNSDIPLKGGDYVVKLVISNYMHEYNFYTEEIDVLKADEYQSFSGKDIEPHGSAIYGYEWGFGVAGGDANASVNITMSPETLLANYQPKGNEFDQYIGATGGTVTTTGSAAPASSSGSGPLSGSYTYSGSIGRNGVNGSMNYSGGTFTGQYGYKGRTTGINISGTLSGDGTWTATERNDQGMVCGTYNGHVNGTTITGTFTNYKGTTYSFTLNLKPA